MNFWSSTETLNRLVFWLTVATIAAPFLFGLSALLVQKRAKTLEDARVESLRLANENLATALNFSQEKVTKLQRDTASASADAKAANAKLEEEERLKNEAAVRRRTPPVISAELRAIGPGKLVVVLKSENLIPFEFHAVVVTTENLMVSGLPLDWPKVFPTGNLSVFYSNVDIQWAIVREGYLELRVSYRSLAPELLGTPGHSGSIVKKYRVTGAREIVDLN